MAKYREFFFDSTDGETRLHAMACVPDTGTPLAFLQIAHGVSEHIRRYDDFAHFMADNGVAVIGHSLLGHGASCTSKTAGFFAEKDGWDVVLNDIRRLHDMVRDTYPGVPLFLFGHSMGSFLARTYLIKYPGEYSGCIISGTGFQPQPVIAAGMAIAKAEARHLGWMGRSTKLYDLCFKSYNKRIKNPVTDYDWLSKDADAVARYVEDEDCGNIATISLYNDMLGGIGFVCSKKNASRMNRSTPVLLMSGMEDPVGNYGKGVEKTFQLFKSAGCIDVDMKLYEGGRHEMLNETNRYQVYTDVLSWLKSHIK